MAAAKYTCTGIAPSLHYENAAAMLDWLSRAFGFEERARYVDRDGNVRQAEMYVGENEVWLNGHEPGYWEKLGRPDAGVVIFVDDVVARGATSCAIPKATGGASCAGSSEATSRRSRSRKAA